MKLLACGIALVLEAAAFGSDCSQCKPDDLCAEHQESEKKALDELRGKIRSKDAAERSATLKAVAALTKKHENAPSRAVADTLAIALDDDSFSIRAEAAELLAEGQHPDAAVKALTKAIDDLRAEYAKLGRNRERGSGDATLSGKGGARYTDAVIEGLAKLPDDRSVDALADVLKQLGPDAPDQFVVPLSKALLQLKSRPAVDAVVDRLVSAEGSRSHSRAGGGAGKAGGGAGGGGAGGGAGGGGAGGGGKPGGGGGRRPGDRDGDGFRDRGADEAQRRAIHDGLAALAAEKKLDDAPPFDDQVAQRWKDWYEKHVASFPAKLGHVGSVPLGAQAPAKS
jgi:hypothetical protein